MLNHLQIKSIVNFCFTVCSISLAHSCRPTEQATLDYKSLNYDTSRICIFKWDTTIYAFPTNSDSLALSQEDLRVTDSLFKDAIDSFKVITSPKFYMVNDVVVPRESFAINQSNFKCQFFPYLDVNWQRVIFIVSFYHDFSDWKTKANRRQARNGIHSVELKVNLSTRTRNDLQVDGLGVIP